MNRLWKKQKKNLHWGAKRTRSTWRWDHVDVPDLENNDLIKKNSMTVHTRGARMRSIDNNALPLEIVEEHEWVTLYWKIVFCTGYNSQSFGGSQVLEWSVIIEIHTALMVANRISWQAYWLKYNVDGGCQMMDTNEALIGFSWI